jgi:hypothetical protein
MSLPRDAAATLLAIDGPPMFHSNGANLLRRNRLPVRAGVGTGAYVQLVACVDLGFVLTGVPHRGQGFAQAPRVGNFPTWKGLLTL